MGSFYINQSEVFFLENNLFKLKNDRYRAARGGEAHLLDISCTRCSSTVIKYQKDGKGNLVRCYLNRIMYPESLEKLQYSFNISNYRDLPALSCPECKSVIGTVMVYDDGRIAYRLQRGNFTKKRIF